MRETNPVRELLVEFGAGKLGEAEVIAQLEKVLVPRHVYPPAADVNDSYRRELADYTPPVTDGSADEIDRALIDGLLTEAQALALFTKVKDVPPVVDEYNPD